MWWSAGDDDVVEVLQELEALSAQVAALSLAAVAEVDRRERRHLGRGDVDGELAVRGAADAARTRGAGR